MIHTLSVQTGLAQLVLVLLSAAATGPALGQEVQVDPLRPPAITTENVPPIPPELAERLQQYENVRSAEFQGWAPDAKGGILIQTRFGDTAQLHRVYEPGGRREQVTFYEGCLSVRGYGALVPRFRAVRVSGVDAEGRPVALRLEGWPARIMQHELDHLDGTLYIDRMLTRSFATDAELPRLGNMPVDEAKRELGIDVEPG